VPLRTVLGKPANRLANSPKGISPGQQVSWHFRIPELDELSAAEAAREALQKIEP